MTEKDYNFFVGTRDLVLYVLERRPRLGLQPRVLLDPEALFDRELLLVSNRAVEELDFGKGFVSP